MLGASQLDVVHSSRGFRRFASSLGTTSHHKRRQWSRFHCKSETIVSKMQGNFKHLHFVWHELWFIIIFIFLTERYSRHSRDVQKFSLNTFETTWAVVQSCNPGVNHGAAAARKGAWCELGVICLIIVIINVVFMKCFVKIYKFMKSFPSCSVCLPPSAPVDFGLSCAIDC